jgi:dihydroorotate dehydrogenase electron transfer subunit
LSAYPIEANKLRTTKILDVEIESPTVKTYVFKDEKCANAKPGQFLMLWILGVDEIPLSILDADENGTVSVAVKNVGEATRALHAKGIGEIVGVRGPFGSSFTIRKGRILMVGGGTGVAPLFFLTKKLALVASRLVFVLGAASKDELLYMDNLQKVIAQGNGRLISTTEDGSCGIMGLCTEPLSELLEKDKFDMIYSCGPEKMIRKVFELAEQHHVGFEASLERLMRCAVGLCGSCVIGKYRVCRDGPVFGSAQLTQVKDEFGVSKLDFDGKRISLA